MRLEEIVSDGFKSYSVRTVISGWDASFNAITFVGACCFAHN